MSGTWQFLGAGIGVLALAAGIGRDGGVDGQGNDFHEGTRD